LTPSSASASGPPRPWTRACWATLLSLVQPDQTTKDRLVIAGLAVLATAWLLLMYTLRPPRWRQRTGAMVVYFAGMLALATVLTTRSWFFVAFAVTGLIQPFFLFPTALAFIAMAATSVVIYTAPAGFPEPTVQAVSGWIFIIVLQTGLTGYISFMGMKLMQEDKQRRELLERLEAALETGCAGSSPTTPTSRWSARPPTARRRSPGSSGPAPTWC
jgi:hypothetical protein